MYNYKIELTSTGTLTQLPDSQKIFGALVYMFSENFGEEKATELTKAVLEKTIHLTLSNIMPLDYLPTPQDFLIDSMSENIHTDENLKEKRDAIKERRYIKPTELERTLTSLERYTPMYPYVKLQDQQQLRASIESGRHNIPVLDSNLYSVPTISILEINLDHKGKKLEKPMNSFCFYLQADDSKINSDLLDLVNAAVAEEQTIILGKRASQGLNTFTFRNVEKQELRCAATSYFLNMGMLLPNEIDFTASTLKLFASERRPFEMSGGWEKGFTRQFISFIAEGSIVCATDGVLKAGKSIRSPFNKNRDIVFGNAFLYPVSLGERGQKHEKIHL